jgi:hypothetical protein
VRGRWFAGWIVVGALGALTVLGALSIGIFILPIFGLAFAFVARHTRYPLDVLGFLAGIGVVLLVIAYANRDYQPCAAGSFSCGGLDPHPWLLAGWAFVAAGLGFYAALRIASRVRPCRR